MGYTKMINPALKEVTKFTNTMKEHFTDNCTIKYITVFLILLLMGLILYCLFMDNKDIMV